MRKFVVPIFFLFLTSYLSAAQMKDLQDLNHLKKIYEANPTSVRLVTLLSPT